MPAQYWETNSLYSTALISLNMTKKTVTCVIIFQQYEMKDSNSSDTVVLSLVICSFHSFIQEMQLISNH